MRSLSVILCPFLLVLFFYNPTILGYTLEGSDWNYQLNPMGESIMVSANTSDTSGALNAILNAIGTWGNASADFKFTYGGNASNPVGKYDGINQVGWVVPSNTELWLAQTVWWSIGSQIVEADIAFNDNYNWASGDTIPSGSYDVQSVALHELGHVLGLGHSVAPAVMQPSISSGLKRRVLTSDDINGILAIYGPATLNNCVDADGDGYYSTSGCGTLVDCNDNDPTIHPGAPEICGDGKDNNCDGRIDEGCCTDSDGDGYFAQPNCGTLVDCDDTNPYVNPGAVELCDGIDNNCNGTIDEGCNLPDLTVSWLSVTRSGSYISGKLQVSNIGMAAALNPFYVRVYLSADAVWDTGDTRIKNYQFSGLDAGAYSTLSFKVKGSGSYLIAVADPTGAVAESDETNNVAVTSAILPLRRR